MGLMTLEEVANYLRVTNKTIYRLIEKHDIPAKKVGRQWRFEEDSIDIWLRQSSVVKTVTILVVDDDEVICSLFRDTLEESGYIVTTFNDPYKALESVIKQDYSLVFLDLKMPGMDGVELFWKIRMNKPKLPITIVTGYPDSDLLMRALVHGPLGVMNKPFRGSDILAAVDNYLRLGQPQE